MVLGQDVSLLYDGIWWVCWLCKSRTSACTDSKVRACKFCSAELGRTSAVRTCHRIITSLGARARRRSMRWMHRNATLALCTHLRGLANKLVACRSKGDGGLSKASAASSASTGAALTNDVAAAR